MTDLEILTYAIGALCVLVVLDIVATVYTARRHRRQLNLFSAGFMCEQTKCHWLTQRGLVERRHKSELARQKKRFEEQLEEMRLRHKAELHRLAEKADKTFEDGFDFGVKAHDKVIPNGHKEEE